MNFTVRLLVNVNNANLIQSLCLYKTLNAKVAIYKISKLIHKSKVFFHFCVPIITKKPITKASCICSLSTLLIYLLDLNL